MKMKLIEQLVEHLHLDCNRCFSENVVPTGKVIVDNDGVYLEVRCLDCGCVDECGDGEFWHYHEIVKVE